MKEPGEVSGLVIAWAGLATFVVLVVVIKTGHLWDLITWAIGAATLATIGKWAVLVGVVVVLVAFVNTAPRRIRIRAPRRHGHAAAEAIRHEALGHAAVGAGVNSTTRGIRARVFSDGSGWCDVPRINRDPAASIAITRAGEAAAGPSGCESDRARARRELSAVPRRQRATTSTRADQLVRRHVGNAFGHRVARALKRTGRFR